MKILVVSDTHRHNDNFYKVMEMHKPDICVHCGDIEGFEDDFQAFCNARNCIFYVVRGNNDYFSMLPRELEFSAGGKKFFVTHGHEYYVSMDYSIVKEEAASRDADVVLFGHTHRPVVDRTGDVIAVNPGSLSYPRQEGRQPSYCIIETDRFEEWHYTIAYL